MFDRDRFRENRFPEVRAAMSHPSFSLCSSRILWAIGLMPVAWVMGTPAIGQIVPDATLPVNSTATLEGNTFVIDGGTAAGRNLFHSFDRFDLPAGFEAFFDNGASLDNIFGRVTGDSISHIDGILRANGTANLFLLNPNGILFGPNAQLDIGGSFFASTAESVLFENGVEFSATHPNGTGTVPLLTVNVPIGLQFGPTPGAIVHRSSAPSLLSHPESSPVPRPDAVGLEVRSGRSLALLGGDLRLEGGHLTSLSKTTESEISQAGTLELGSISGRDRLDLTPTATGFEVGYDDVRHFGNIELSGGATVNAGGLGGGRIRVRGDRIFLHDGASLQADTWGDLDGRGIELQSRRFDLGAGSFVSASTLASGNGGGIEIDTSESVNLTGTSFADFQNIFVLGAFFGTLTPLERGSGLFSVTGGEGNAGDIDIETRTLTLTEGAVAIAPTFDRGTGGNLNIIATESIEVVESSLTTGSSIGSSGSTGNIEIATRQAIVRDGSSIQAFTFGSQPGGDIVLRASESVEILRNPPGNNTITGIATTTLGTSAAGDITVETERLILEDGGEILTTSGLANPGTRTLDRRGGGGGTLIVRASESVELSGISEDGILPSGLVSASFSISDAPAGDLSIETQRLTIRDGAVVSASTIGRGNGGNAIVRATQHIEVAGTSASGLNPSNLSTSSGEDVFSSFPSPGAAGNLEIFTERLIVRDGGEISVSSVDTGNSGTLNVDADSIRLERGGIITATTNSGDGGNIAVHALELQLRQESHIAANGGNTDGGNITLETDTLVALENSDITANAEGGRGGRVEIATRSLFGTAFRPELTPQSDITATSKLGAQFDGIVTLRTPDLDPSAGLVQLPSNPTDRTNRVVSHCGTTEGSTFAIIGRGGLPEDPTLAVQALPSWSDTRNWRELGSGSMAAIGLPVSPTPALVEATGWIRRADGTIELVAHLPNSMGSAPPECESDLHQSVRRHRSQKKDERSLYSSG